MCEYCDFEITGSDRNLKDRNLKEGSGDIIFVDIFQDREDKVLYNITYEDYEGYDIRTDPIYYCPMCGRKLGE